nr:phospholipase-like protein [Tanacetum cinerariifolium]GEY48828.1 phospholipase-like protein [Tanacetum cinerariifolium]GEY49622.1 phospholipase-like protein [Tanacetum cinerariifolium]
MLQSYPILQGSISSDSLKDWINVLINTYKKGIVMVQDSNPIFDLRTTLAEYKFEWWTSTNDFLKVYIPQTPIRKLNIFDAYLQKVSATGKRNRFCKLISTSNTNVPRSKISCVKDSIIMELNSCIFKLEAIIQAFLELFEVSIIDSVRTPLDVDTQEEFDEIFMRRLEKGERSLLEEKTLKEEEIKVRLEEQKRLRLEEDRTLEVKKKWEEDYRKRSYAFMNSDHMKQPMTRCAPKKRSHYVAVKTNSWLIVCSKFDKKKQSFGLVDRDMTEFLKMLNLGLSEDLDIYLGKPGHLRCKFSWSKEVRLPKVLELLNVLDKKGIDKSTYQITFSIAENVPKQEGVFGDCRAWLVKLLASSKEFPIILYPEEDTHILGQCALDHFSNPAALSFLYASGLSALMP